MKDSPSQLLVMSEHSQLVTEEESNVEDSRTRCRKRCPRILLIFIGVYLVLLVFFLSIAVLMRKQSARPHVIIMIADDLGWNDVEWNDPDMRTPALKDLLDRGAFLNNSYVHPLDSPSRAALFTGLYPFHMGLQHEKMLPHTPTFVPDNVTMMPAHLQNLGYRTVLLGKWHLGFCNLKYTPLPRGFNTFNGYYTDDLDYYSHRDIKGNYDFRSGEMVDFSEEGTHSTRVLADKATHIIFNHEVTVPLFMVVSFQAVHSPAQVPDVYVNETCAHITDTNRRTMCALTAMMDEAIGNVTSMLYDKDMLSNSVIIVTSDNGGVEAYGSDNGPFRGENGELYEGGTRVMTLLSSDLLSVQGYTYTGLFHQVDWFPTILSSIDADFVKGLDGLNHWHAIRSDSTSPRNELVYNIDETYHNAAIRIDNFKLIEGHANYTHPGPAHALAPRLYDLDSDPGENDNLADAMPKKVEYFKSRLESMRKTVIPAVDKKADPKSDPALYNNIWAPGWC